MQHCISADQRPGTNLPVWPTEDFVIIFTKGIPGMLASHVWLERVSRGNWSKDSLREKREDLSMPWLTAFKESGHCTRPKLPEL